MSDHFLRRARIGYWLAWLPMTGLVIVLLSGSQLEWLGAVLIGLPLCLLFALISRSTWYMCKTLPLRRTSLLRLLTIHGGSAALAGGLWAGIALSVVPLLPQQWGLGLRAESSLLFGMGAVTFLLGVAFHYVVLGLEQSRQADRRAADARALAKESELRALRAQIDPHFLFNSLNSVAALVGSDPSGARQMCLNLAGFLRTSLRLGDRSRVPLADELELAREYLAVEQVRFADRLRVTERIEDDCLNLPIPPLVLQPLVENAVKHGIAGLTDGGELLIAARIHGQRLSIRVCNPYDPDAPKVSGTGRGAELVRRRVEALYGPDARVLVDRAEQTYSVELRLPLEQRSA
jgi:two-component system sensor histidine kinase AlgZ